jgi:hypothetical protein
MRMVKSNLRGRNAARRRRRPNPRAILRILAERPAAGAYSWLRGIARRLKTAAGIRSPRVARPTKIRESVPIPVTDLVL